MWRKRRFGRNSLLLKMLFSILGLICIPLICMQLAMILHANREFKRETTTHNQYALASLAASFGSQLDEISNTMYRMSIDEEITRFVSEEVTGYPLAQTAVKINRYALDSSLLSSVGVYYVEKDICLHNTYKRSLDHICGDFFPEGTEGYVALAEFLRNTDSKDFFYTGNYPQVKRRGLIIAKAFSAGSASCRDVVIFFTMDASAFDRWCTMFMPTGESFAILDANGNYLFRGEDFLQDFVQETDFRGFLTNREAAYVPGDNSGLILYKCRDSFTGFTFLVSMVKQTAEENFTKYASRAAFSVAMTVLLTVLLLSVTLYINYKPVSRLMQKHFRHNSEETGLSELALIDSHFFALDQRLNDQVRLLDTFIMGDLLSGVRVEQSTLEKYYPENQYCCFIVAACAETLTTAQSCALCRKFQDLPGEKLIVTALPYQSETVFVYAAGMPVEPKQLQQMLQEAVTEVGMDCKVLVGASVALVTEIRTSYNSIWGVEPSDTKREDYPRIQMTEFAQHLRGKSWGKALQMLDRLENAAFKLSDRRFFQTKLLHIFLTEVEKSGQVLLEQETDRLLETADGQLFESLRKCLLAFEDGENADGKVSSEALRKRLLEYVDCNYTKSNLCLTSAADYLKTSVYTVSRVFKEVTGYGFKEYIVERRLQQASYLLRESELTVAEVAAACGFESTNYFTAVFRMKHSMPPAKYRKEMAGMEDGVVQKR